MAAGAEDEEDEVAGEEEEVVGEEADGEEEAEVGETEGGAKADTEAVTVEARGAATSIRFLIS